MSTSNFIPLYLFHNSNENLWRVDISKSPPPQYSLVKTMYVLDHNIALPHINLTKQVLINNNQTGNYSTIKITNQVEMPIIYQQLQQKKSSNVQVLPVCVFLRHVPNSHPFIYSVGKDKNGASILTVFDEPPNKGLPYYEHVNFYVFFYFEKPFLYWEPYDAICIPSDNPKMYQTLAACQVHTYNHIHQKFTYINNASLLIKDVLENYNQQTSKKDNILYKTRQNKNPTDNSLSFLN